MSSDQMRACGVRTFEVAEFQDDEKAKSHREHLTTDVCDKDDHL
jgi:hypothetical protein